MDNCKVERSRVGLGRLPFPTHFLAQMTDQAPPLSFGSNPNRFVVKESKPVQGSCALLSIFVTFFFDTLVSCNFIRLGLGYVS